jgi:hypothetical protein
MAKGQKEVSFETGMDEQYKQAAAQNTTEKVAGHDRRNDYGENFYEAERNQRLKHQMKLDSLELAEREMRLKAEQRNDTFLHMANLKSLTHSGKAFEELIEKDAEEAQATKMILEAADLESLVEKVVRKVLATQ